MFLCVGSTVTFLVCVFVCSLAATHTLKVHIFVLFTFLCLSTFVRLSSKVTMTSKHILHKPCSPQVMKDGSGKEGERVGGNESLTV